MNTRLAIGARRQWVARTRVSFIKMVMHITSYSSLSYVMQKIFGFKGSSPLWVSTQITINGDLTFLLCVACGMTLTLNDS